MPFCLFLFCWLLFAPRVRCYVYAIEVTRGIHVLDERSERHSSTSVCHHRPRASIEIKIAIARDAIRDDPVFVRASSPNLVVYYCSHPVMYPYGKEEGNKLSNNVLTPPPLPSKMPSGLLISQPRARDRHRDLCR